MNSQRFELHATHRQWTQLTDAVEEAVLDLVHAYPGWRLASLELIVDARLILIDRPDSAIEARRWGTSLQGAGIQLQVTQIWPVHGAPGHIVRARLEHGQKHFA